MKALIELIKSYTHKGVAVGMNPSEEKVVVLTNYVLLIAFIVAVTKVLIFASIETSITSITSLVSLIAALLFFVAYFLNTKGYYTAAKSILVIVGNIAAFYNDIKFGGDTGLSLLLFAAIAVYFVIFTLKDKSKIFIYSAFTIILIGIISFYPNILKDAIAPPEGLKQLAKFTTSFFTILILVYVNYNFLKKSSEAEQKMMEANNELSNSKDLLIEQNRIIETAHSELKEVNEELYSSMRYAESIQNKLLPDSNQINEFIKEYFIYYKSKDILSGDFYWFAESHGKLFIAVVDCTGHGIPGSMLSIAGQMILNDAVKSIGLKDPDLILEYLNSMILKTLQQNNESTSIKDGMDICLITVQDRKLTFSGANRPLFYFENDEFKEIKGSRASIGGHKNSNNAKFENHEINLLESNKYTFYLFTDGLVDYTDKDGRKVGTKKLREIFAKIHNLPHTEQNLFIQEYFNDYTKQRDDITLWGIKF
jgi:serine phosphatase RsbU (regulator of sigma subunit)